MMKLHQRYSQGDGKESNLSDAWELPVSFTEDLSQRSCSSRLKQTMASSSLTPHRPQVSYHHAGLRFPAPHLGPKSPLPCSFAWFGALLLSSLEG